MASNIHDTGDDMGNSRPPKRFRDDRPPPRSDDDLDGMHSSQGGGGGRDDIQTMFNKLFF